jgi:TetR/AcrR family transcriptional regulator, multidrug resistance operon repressor
MNIQLMTIPDKKQAVIEAMLALVVEKGFHGTPMSLVAQQAGVAAGTIYHYFDSKEAVLNELYGLLKAQMGAAMLQPDQADQPFKARFFRFWLNLFDYFTGHPKEFTFLEMYANSSYINQLTREENEAHYAPVVEFLAQGIQAGVLRPLDLRLMVALTYGSVVAAAKLHLSGQPALTPAQVQQAAQSGWDGVRID